jgi:hypothetical protein
LRVDGCVTDSWRGAEDLAGDVVRLRGVVLADAARHEETFDEAEKGGNAGPEEDEVEDAEAVAAKIEVMCAEVSEEEGEEDTDDFVFAGALIFGKEPGSLVFVHGCGIDGIDGVHGSVLLEFMLGRHTLEKGCGFPLGSSSIDHGEQTELVAIYSDFCEE